MKRELTIATIAVAALMVTFSSVAVNQAFAFPGENGKGHTTSCENNGGQSEGGSCHGNLDRNHKCQTTFAGKSNHVKDQTGSGC
jgi:hypothetical protein